MNPACKEHVYIIIPVHNRKNITLNCLENLKQCGNLERYHTVVVDDGSTDGTSKAIEAQYPDVVILKGDGNLWWTGAIRKGMEYAYKQGAQYFIWLNDDCLVSDNAISDLVEFCRENTDAIIGCQGSIKKNINLIAFGGKIQNWTGEKLINCPQGKIMQCDLLSGNLVCIPKIAITKIGFPDAINLPHYGGDAFFIIRARKSGFKIFVDHRNEVVSVLKNGDSKVSPEHWLLREGKPLDILKLVFIRHSLLNWRIWLKLNLEEYEALGLFTYVVNYLILKLIQIILITILRFLPIHMRQELSRVKHLIKNTFNEKIKIIYVNQ